jgi:hypothetical protein
MLEKAVKGGFEIKEGGLGNRRSQALAPTLRY